MQAQSAGERSAAPTTEYALVASKPTGGRVSIQTPRKCHKIQLDYVDNGFRMVPVHPASTQIRPIAGVSLVIPFIVHLVLGPGVQRI